MLSEDRWAGTRMINCCSITTCQNDAGASGTGIERPVPEWVDLNQSLHRIVAFIDVCGFTRFTDQYGAHSAIEMLTRFRSACRDVTARRGTRVAKWMGDGVMLVGAEAGPVVATAAELLLRVEDEGFDIHGGIAAGMMLLFEGDDYIGRPVNLAARLCEAAAPGELLAVGVRDAGHIDPALFALFLESGVYLDYARRFMQPACIDEVDVAALLQPAA